jgi:hypothetical protein
LKLNKFIIPVGISLAAFIWGYRGELWFGKVEVNSPTTQAPITESPPPEVNKRPKISPSSTAVITPTPILPPGPIPGGPPIKAKELPLTTPGEGEDYAPEDDVQEAEDGEEADEPEIEDAEADQADDQSLPEDEPGADNSENEEVDSDANEGDLQADETADTAESKPVKP